MLGATLGVDQYVQRLQSELARVDQKEIQTWADLVYEAWENEKFVFVFGNGGSATTATHICEDLGKSSLHQHDLKDESKKRLKVLSLTDNLGWILAVGNDVGYDQIFVQQLMNYGSAGDLVIAISGSGNSPNVLARRRLGQSSRTEDLRPDRLRRRQAAQDGTRPACTCRWTTWAWSRAFTCACSTGCSTTSSPASITKAGIGSSG